MAAAGLFICVPAMPRQPENARFYVNLLTDALTSYSSLVTIASIMVINN